MQEEKAKYGDKLFMNETARGKSRFLTSFFYKYPFLCVFMLFECLVGIKVEIESPLYCIDINEDDCNRS